MKASVENIYKDRAKLLEMGHRARAAAETKYTVSAALEKYKSALNDCRPALSAPIGDIDRRSL
jgi:hypothetical protein